MSEVPTCLPGTSDRFHLRAQLSPKGLSVLVLLPLPIAAVARFVL